MNITKIVAPYSGIIDQIYPDGQIVQRFCRTMSFIESKSDASALVNNRLAKHEVQVLLEIFAPDLDHW